MKVSIPMGSRLTAEQFPKTKKEIEDMAHVPYEFFFGILMYATECTSPDISHIVGVLSRYMSTHRKEHWKIAKRVSMYLCDTKDYGICYQ
jgi:N-acyl-L-homoserine lactone synthetase